MSAVIGLGKGGRIMEKGEKWGVIIVIVLGVILAILFISHPGLIRGLAKAILRSG